MLSTLLVDLNDICDTSPLFPCETFFLSIPGTYHLYLRDLFVLQPVRKEHLTDSCLSYSAEGNIVKDVVGP